MGAPSQCLIPHTRLLLVQEKVRILVLEEIFSFPCELRTLPRVPTNFNDGDTALLELLYFPVYASLTFKSQTS
ncbi:hypothetical protein Tco_1129581 [Tanacetum coccineum]